MRILSSDLQLKILSLSIDKLCLHLLVVLLSVFEISKKEKEDN